MGVWLRQPWMPPRFSPRFSLQLPAVPALCPLTRPCNVLSLRVAHYNTRFSHVSPVTMARTGGYLSHNIFEGNKMIKIKWWNWGKKTCGDKKVAKNEFFIMRKGFICHQQRTCLPWGAAACIWKYLFYPVVLIKKAMRLQENNKT